MVAGYPSVLSIAIVGRNNEPLYLKDFTPYYERDGGGNDYNDGEEKEKVHKSIFAAEEELFGLSLDEQHAGEEDSSLSFSSTNYYGGCSLRQQFLLHEALDRFDHLVGPPPGMGFQNNPKKNATAVGGPDAMFIGLLCPIEETRIYGYMTTTKIKFILIIEDDELDATSGAHQILIDERIKSLLMNIHSLFVDYTLNPFSTLETEISSPIISQRFERGIQDCIMSFSS